MHSSVTFPGAPSKQVRFTPQKGVPELSPEEEGRPSAEHLLNDTGIQNEDAGGLPKVAGRKRKRDVRAIPVFKNTIYGEKGLPRWHAMITRHPQLMYRPEGLMEARQKMKKYEAHRATGEEKKEHVSLTDAQTEDELLALFQEARRQEGVVEVEDQCPAPTPQEEELAHHHHAQLETLIRLFYEFNHVTFMKIPVLETLNLLARCGREAAAHTIEFESHLRMKREEKMNTLRELRNEEHALRVRQEALQQASEEMMEEAEIQRHEEMARELELEEQKLSALEHVEEEQAPVVDGVPEEDTNPPEEA